MMPLELRIWVSEHKPESVAQASELAENYVQARKMFPTHRLSTGEQREGLGKETRKCHSCHKEGHLARDCPERDPHSTPPEKEMPSGTDKVKKPLKCFNCSQVGHIAVRCPNIVTYYMCATAERTAFRRSGTVEGTRVEDAVLDTGCTQTMVRRELIPESQRIEGETAAVTCAHGDTVLYPMAEVEMELEGVKLQVTAALSDTLPVSILLGTDVPELGARLGGLLRANPHTVHSEGSDQALVVTRAQVRRHEEEVCLRQASEQASEVQMNSISDMSSEGGAGDLGEESDETTASDVDSPSDDDVTTEESVEQPLQCEILGHEFTADFVPQVSDLGKLTRSQKRRMRRKRGLTRAKDRLASKWQDPDPELSVSQAALRQLQETDESLSAMRAIADEEENSTVFWDKGILYRTCRNGKQWINQIVLPKQYRRQLLQLAHSSPMSGHLAQAKTSSRIQKRFYWPTLFRDVDDYCKSCEVCQKTRRSRTPRVPMIPLPIIEEPFSRITMDIVGPLPRSRSGHRFVLVLFDYATRYLEAIPMKSADAENVAEELVKVFARLGIPREILSDQGSSFQSKLLQELYCLLRVEALRTSPYHPQTDSLVEHFNKILEDMLRKAATEDGKDWDKHIPDLLRTLGDQLSRNQCHLKTVTGENAAIRQSPYRLPQARRSQMEPISTELPVHREAPGKQNSSYPGLIVTDIK